MHSKKILTGETLVSNERGVVEKRPSISNEEREEVALALKGSLGVLPDDPPQDRTGEEAATAAGEADPTAANAKEKDGAENEARAQELA